MTGSAEVGITEEDTRTIHRRLLRALAHNRHPGFHFCGYFLDTQFDEISPGKGRLAMHNGPHIDNGTGQAHLAPFCVLVDIALATGVRSLLPSPVRLATVNLNIQLTGAPRVGRLTADSTFQGFVHGAAGQQGISQAVITSDSCAGSLCLASGTFMVLPAPSGTPMPTIPRYAHSDLETADLNDEEHRILAQAERALARSRLQSGSFIDHFLGYEYSRTPTGASGHLANGPHIANRVGHVQGGVMLGLALTTAAAALPNDWLLTAANACYLVPGEGAALNAESTFVHRGRSTAVIRTRLFSDNGRQVLEVTSTHSCLQARQG
ncbi:acyl-CoA thioesterase domain-containing protein [Pseudomonas lopnurensis]|uniref:acyl-CoA thioesterase domain-containing protein n=1 Tax=Pseudomonas lopnurensis TaxID=1477517 RepID=UPI0028B20848|nr:acyl-CoA thioesterase domain-containing protein [Pseudomonas lopnurensis]